MERTKRIVLIFPVMPKRKLHIVKGIKAATGMGLRDAKAFMDKACDNIGRPFVLELLSPSSLADLMDNIEDSGDEVLLNSYTLRELNLYKLGAGSIEDYHELLEKEIILFKNTDILKSTLNKLTKEQLVEISKEIRNGY